MLMNFLNSTKAILFENNKYYLSPSIENEHVVILKDNRLIEVPNINIVPTPFYFERAGDNIVIKTSEDEFICPVSDNEVGICDQNTLNKKYWKLDKESLGIRFINQNMCMGTGKITGISSDAIATIRPLKMSICGNNPDPTLSFDVFSTSPFTEKVNFELLSHYAVGSRYRNYNTKENPESFDKLFYAQQERKPSFNF